MQPSVFKDTVLVSLRVPGRSRHVEQDEPGFVRLVDDDLVELDGGVHPPDVGVVPEGKQDAINNRFMSYNAERSC